MEIVFTCMRIITEQLIKAQIYWIINDIDYYF